MTSMNKLLFSNLIFILLFSLNAVETVLIPENSLLFQYNNADNNWAVKAVAQRDFYSEITKKEKVFLKQRDVIGIYVDVYYLKNPGTDELCYFPEVRFDRDKDGVITPSVDRINSLMYLGILTVIIGIAALAGYFHLKSEKKYYLLPAALLLFFLGYSLWYIGFISNAFGAPADELYYFDIAKKLLTGNIISEKYRYTAGFPILYIPFIIFLRAQNCLEFMQPYMNFQTFILIPGLFLVLYRLFYKKMGASRIQSFFILLLWLILMVFYLPISGSTDHVNLYIPKNYYSNASFSLIENNIYSIFVQSTWLGRNAMSDYAAVFLSVILLYGSMQKSRSLVRFFVLSMGFGFLCLVRINYILFAPLLALVFYDSFSELWTNKRNYLYAALCGAAGFMFVVGWQLVLNKIQFGSPFIGPYSLHKYGPDRGFGFDVIPYGFKFLCHTNYIYVILGISSLFFISERKNRVLLTLWIFPMLLFFCGYPGVFNSPTRFTLALYPPLLAALVMNPVWQAAWIVRSKAALVLFSSCLLCKSDIFFTLFQPWNLGKFGISNTGFMVIQGMVCLFCCAVIISMRKELRTDYVNTISHFRFLILYTAVFFLGSVCVYIAGILVLAAFVYGLRDTWTVILDINGRSNGAAPHGIPSRY